MSKDHTYNNSLKRLIEEKTAATVEKLMHIQPDVIEKCKKGDAHAQSTIYSYYAPRVMGICYRYAGNRDDADDILQEAFIKVFLKLDTFKNEGSFEGWIKRIVVNTALNHIKKNLAFKYSEDVEEVREDENLYVNSIYDMDTEHVMLCIGKLPNGYRTVLNLYAIEGYSHKEIAVMLGINEKTSSSQYFRAKHLLQKLLAKY